MKLDYPAQAQKHSARRPMPDTVDPNGRAVATTRVAQWLNGGMRAALIQPTLWMGLFAICASLLMLFRVLPLLRPLVVLAAPLVAGALAYVQEQVRCGERASFAQVLHAVRAKSNALLAIGLMSGAIVAIGYVFVIATMNLSLLASIMTTGMRAISISYGGDTGMSGTIESLVNMPMFAIAVGAAWFAPALVMLHDVAPLEAMMASLNGAARNWGAAACYLVLLGGAALLAPVVPLFVSALIATPLLLLSFYGAYRDVFAKP